MTACTNFPVFAADADEPVPADIGKAAYEKLFVLQQTYDLNSDGVITMEELSQVKTLTLDLDDCTSIDWLGDLKDCKYLSLSNGSYTDLSMLKNMTSLVSLNIKNVPISDISFVSSMSKLETFNMTGLGVKDISVLKKLDLNECTMTDMPQITDAQRLDIAKNYGDVTVEKGFNEKIGIRPKGIFESKEVKLTVEDNNIANLHTPQDSINGYSSDVFGKNIGSTGYKLMVGGKEMVSGKITVKEGDVFSPKLHDTVSDMQFCSGTTAETIHMILSDGTLYTINGNKVTPYAENVVGFSTIERRDNYNIYYNYDMLVQTNGTLTINGKKQVGSFKGTAFGCFWNDSGELYTVFPKNTREFTIVKITDDFKEFLDDGKNLYVSSSGEVMRYKASLDSNDKPVVSTEPSGIFDPKTSLSMMILDKDNVLWKFNPNNPNLKTPFVKMSENVIRIDRCETDDFVPSYVYFCEDGSVHEIGGGKEVKLAEKTRSEQVGYVTDSVVPLYHIDDGSGKPFYRLRYVHTIDNVLTFTFKDQHMAVSDVEKYLCLQSKDGIENGFAYFCRTDGSVWYYDIAENTCKEALSIGTDSDKTETVKGDVNGDGKLRVSDLTDLSKWLLGNTKELKNWKAGDLNSDGTLDTFDLCLLRKLIIKQ